MLQKEQAQQRKPSKLNWRTRLLKWVFAWEPWRRPGSRVRWVLSRVVLYASIALMVEACWSQWVGAAIASPVFAIIGCTFSVGFFAYQLVIIPLLTNQTFHIDARRLFTNAMISMAFVILTFAHLYRVDGLSGEASKTALDFVYFSAVTFSTLGFGDLSPVTIEGRLGAALQALIGNLHLAVIVGAVFLRMSRRKPDKLT